MANTSDDPPTTTDRLPASELLHGREIRRRALGSIVRVTLVTASVCLLYVVAPLDEDPDGAVVAQLALALLVVAVVMALQIVSVARSPYPRLRALEAVAVSLPLLLLVFAAAYVVIDHSDQASFTEPLNRIDSIYFTMTVFSTVGFGDIAAKSDVARVLVTIQMLADLVLIGASAKVLFRTARQRRQSLTAGLHSGGRGSATVTPSKADDDG